MWEVSCILFFVRQKPLKDDKTGQVLLRYTNAQKGRKNAITACYGKRCRWFCEWVLLAALGHRREHKRSGFRATASERDRSKVSPCLRGVLSSLGRKPTGQAVHRLSVSAHLYVGGTHEKRGLARAHLYTTYRVVPCFECRGSLTLALGKERRGEEDV